MTPVLALSGVRVVYRGLEALAVEALEVNPGEILGVVGPNGSGKSTLLRVLGLLERPAAGLVRFHGRPVDARRALAERRRMASVFQQSLLADTTVAGNVALGLRFRGVPPEEEAARVERWLGRLNIAPLRDRRARTLSAGEAQRVALARALVLAPEVLLLDEPFTALDPPSRATLIADLGRILREDRITTVLVAHDRGEVRALADRVAVLLGGRLRQVDVTARVFWAPVSEEVARFVGIETIVDGRVATADGGVAVVEVAGRRVEVAAAAQPGDRLRLAIRPEDVTLVPATERTPVSSARNRLPGTVVRLTPSPPYVHALVDCGFPLVAALTPRSAADLGLAPGVPVAAVFKASAVHVLGAGGTGGTGGTGGLLDTPGGPGL